MHTSNSTQPTPTPWTWARQNPGALTEGENELFFINSVAFELSKANAAFIVRAVNSHADLVAALEDAEFLMRRAGKIAGPMQGSFNRSAQDARAVLAKLST